MVSRWESGHREPTLQDLRLLAPIYAFSIDSFVRDTVPGAFGRRWSSRAHGPASRQRIGNALRSARIARGLTVRELRDRSGVPAGRLLALEEGVDASLGELRALRSVLELDLGSVGIRRRA